VVETVARAECYDVRVTPESNAEATRGRSDEAVRRLREESARRVERERRWRGLMSWCALASILGGVSLVALDAYEARVQSVADPAAEANELTARQRARAEAAAADEAARRARSAAACAKRASALDAIHTAEARALRRVKESGARDIIRFEAMSRAVDVIDSATYAGCTEPASIPEDL
jgi:hypothetical protein